MPPTPRPLSPQCIALVQLLVVLSGSLHALLGLKDLRTPLLLRVMLRPAVVLVAPLLSGSVLAGWGLIGRPVTAAGQVFAIVVGCIVSDDGAAAVQVTCEQSTVALRQKDSFKYSS